VTARGGHRTGRRTWLTGLLAMCLLAAPVHADGWWRAFGHDGLTAAIEQGLADHPDPIGALARVRSAEAMAQAERSERRPMAMADAAYRWGREQSDMTGGMAEDIDPLMAAARVSWEIDLFDRIGASVAAADAMTAMRFADAEAIRLALSLEIAHATIEHAQRTEDLAWLDRMVADARALRDRAARRVEAGLDDPATLRRAEAEVQEMEHEQMEAEALRDQAVAMLRGLLGGTLPPTLPDTLDGFTLPPMPEFAQTNMYLARPDVVAAYQAWQAAEGGARSAARDRLPSLALVASAAGEGDGSTNPEEWEAWAGPVLTVPLWEPRRGSRARGAEAGADDAEAMFEAVSLRAMQEIDAAWANRTRSESMIDHMAERVAQLAAEEASMARQRDAGLVDDAEVRMARIERAAAARGWSAWRAAGLRHHVTLVGALGGDPR
jgi:outer membrane protein TolC